MDKSSTRLTDAFLRTLRIEGRFFDTERTGLYVWVRRSGAAPRFYQRIRVGDRKRDLAIGAYGDMSLAAARDRARENQRIARAGGDPTVSGQRTERHVPTFADALEQKIAINAADWRSGGKSAAQWQASMQKYVLPRIGDLPVTEIGVGEVFPILEPIWSTRAETSRRILQRIVAVMNWAVAAGHLDHNPVDAAAIRAGLSRRRPKKKNFRSLPYAELATGLHALRTSGADLATVLCAE